MLNQITIMGRLVADPELKSTNTGKNVTSFRIACDRDYKAGEEKAVDFIDCVAWRQSAEFICRNFRKGMPILISGRLQIREYVNRNEQKVRVAEINVESSYFCGGERTAAPAKSQGFEDMQDDGNLPWDDDEGLPL